MLKAKNFDWYKFGWTLDAKNQLWTEDTERAEFIQSDICDVCFHNEFDVVLNLTDGAVGYLETDEENLKIFHTVRLP